MIAKPVSLPMLVEIIRAAVDADDVLTVHGGRTKTGWLLDRGPPATVPIDMTGLSGVVSHDHGDMTATVLAGTPFAVFQAAVAARGQRLAIDPPLGPNQTATVGGIFGADDSGPGRLAYGSLRELCIGGSFVLADGTVAKSGSKVIKNVAGYDLCKLLCGSRGTLGIVTELTVRLHPVPAAERSVVASLSLAEAVDNAFRLRTQVEADAMTYSVASGERGRLAIRLTGPTNRVHTHATVIRTSLGADTPPEVFDREASQARWHLATEERRARPGETTVAISVPLARVSAFAAGFERWAADEPCAYRLTADLLLGTFLVSLAADDPSAHSPAVTALRSLALAERGHARLRDRAPGLEGVDPFGPLPGSLPLMARVKAALDPAGRLSPGRYLTNP